jgi:P pilus assembly chaperone PapD
MRNVIIGMDSCLDSNDINKSNKGRLSKSAPNFVINRSGLIWIIAIGVALLVSANPAFGQFTVQPMKLELAVTPGKLIKSTINVRSFDPNGVHNISMSVVELSQLEDGTWDIIEPNDIKDPNSPHFGFDLSKLSSCSDWISMEPDNFNLDPVGVQPVEVTLRVERGVRGFFGAGIIAKTSPMQGVGDVSVVVRFFVPVIIEIQDRPARPVVQATDIGLEFIKASADYKARSMVTMNIVNDGGTYSRIQPTVRIWSFTDGHWRVITTTEFQEKSIMPGARLKLSENIRKPLPSGKYKVAGYLFVDGRRAKKIEKEIDFVGDTSISVIAVDAPLDLDPIDLSMEGMPGASRTSTIKVYNASKETVNIQTAMGLPSILQLGTLGDVKGEDLDCTQWLKITPEQFTLRGDGGVQTLRVVNTMPNDLPVPYPSYFSLLALWATYPDGQKAGHTTTNICVRNKQIAASPSAVALKLTLQELGESNYLVVARFGNYGMVHFVPIRVKAGLAMPNGIHRISTFLSGNPNLMLPFETRDFSGVLDLTYIPADVYRLAAAIEYAPGVWADKQIAVRVSIEGGQRIAKVVGIEEELNELIEVQW